MLGTARKRIRGLCCGRGWRWLLRLAVLGLTGVLLTIASAWVLQWRGFSDSAKDANWSMDLSVSFGIPDYHYVGDGVFISRWFFDTSPLPQTVPLDINHVPDVPWFVVQGDERSWVVRNEWDYTQTVDRDAVPHGVPVIPSAHYHYQSNAFTYAPPNHPKFEFVEAVTPERAIDVEPLKTNWFVADRYFTYGPGWFAGSSFRINIDQSIHAIDRPVERWSAQRAGWPMHALMTEQYAIGPRPPIKRVRDMPVASLRHGIRGGLILHHLPQHPMLHPLGYHSLPLMPLWPGFIVNSIFYSACIAALWLGFAGTRHALGRKRRRRGRGQCESCGYDMRGLVRCPECGTTIHPGAQE